ncbi:PKD domain-containing protein [Undibacterium amnicola]|uniref:PKD domain-containing protein n=1 Tax=Undibacterium amnicola TaxID=1834038 RepID=A0ABR6XSD2_9BURK|nr:YCF48-related protein [Undibacterium amnicola]MBC3832375.1 PKD domain-containing protein [Undibacterium amnicola]
MLNQLFTVRIANILLIGAVFLISACGSNSNISPTQNTVVLPPTLELSAPPKADLTEIVTFSSNTTPQPGLKFVWFFGDGSSSTDATPQHQYSKSGDYEVILTVSNTLGHSIESKTKISISNLAGLRGLMCSGTNDTGWCWQASKPSRDTTNSFTLANATTGWRVGNAGDIFKTQDAGRSWQRQPSGVNVNLYQIKNFDDKIAWVLGANNTLLQTLDGGTNWRTLVSPIDVRGQSPEIIVFSANDLLLESGSNSYLTDDGGLTWYSVDMTSARHTEAGIIYELRGSHLFKSTRQNRQLRDIMKFEDGTGARPPQIRIGLSGENVVIARGRVIDVDASGKIIYDRSLAWRSEDAGEHWTPYTILGLPIGSEGSDIYSLDKDGKTWLTLHADIIYRSDDGGMNWREQTYLSEDQKIFHDDILQILVHGSKIFMLSQHEYYSRLRFSEDLGKTWVEVKGPLIDGVRGIQINTIKFVNDALIVHNELIGSFVSTDIGINWKQVFIKDDISANASHGVAFANTKNGLLVDTSSHINSSNDGGKTWTLKTTTLPKIPYNDQLLKKILFASPSTVYLLWSNGYIYKSRDGGATWTNSGPSIVSTNFNFLDEKNGWAYLGISPGTITITRDGGASWKEVATPSSPINNVWLDNTSTLTVIGNAGLISQFNNVIWQQRYTGTSQNLRKVYSLDSKTMWVIGDNATVLRSDDAGQNWKTVYVPGQANLNDIQFIDTKNGWIVGEHGLVLVTQDGGITWKQQNTGTKAALLQVQFVDTKTGWIVGENATLLATGTGGF